MDPFPSKKSRNDNFNPNLTNPVCHAPFGSDFSTDDQGLERV